MSNLLQTGFQRSFRIEFLLNVYKRGTLGFSVSRFWTFFRSVFRFSQQETAVFRFWCLLRFSGFPSISIWFSVSGKNTSGFSDLVFALVSGFPIWFTVSLRSCW